MTNNSYDDFLSSKTQSTPKNGFKPVFEPDWLFDFQEALVTYSVEQGRSAIFADCGMGKTPMQLAWAQNVVEHTNKPVLIITPLAVAHQTIKESEKFGIECGRNPAGISNKKISVTNYERLHYFDPNDFAGVVCDESSAIKHFTGARQQAVTTFMRKMPYRLLCTATAAPNDYIELGTSSEALGQLGRMDMLGRFFRSDENSLHPIQFGARWSFKAHSEQDFWRWVCSWSRALRRPSDLGFDDGRFNLPPLITNEHIVERLNPPEGMLFTLPAQTLQEQQKERRETVKERCEKVAEIIADKKQSIAWCHLNAEGDLLEKIIPGAIQVSGSNSDEEKEEKLISFASGESRVLVTKPKIGAFGLNFQNCNHMTFFPSHSFEQYYQAVRRCWRFGQKEPVTVDVVTTDGEADVLSNLQRKTAQADEMFDQLVKHMNNSLSIDRTITATNDMEIPAWL